MKLKNANSKKEFGRLLETYQIQINELIDQRAGWREMAIDFQNSRETRELARQQVVIITKNIAELEAARQRFIEESF